MKLPQIPFYKKYNLMVKAIIIGSVIGLFFSLLTNAGTDFDRMRLLPAVVIGISISMIVVIFERLFQSKESLSFVATILLKTLLYSLSILIFLLLWVIVFAELLGHREYKIVLGNYIQNRLLRDYLFSLGASIFLILFFEVSSLLNRRFFVNYFLGHYHRPKLEDRIFMFVDVKSSTTIAEQLGDLQYSSLLQDLFSDFTDGILASRAEVYQYAGDEIILTWKRGSGLEDARCLFCFYLLKQSIQKREGYYLNKYNLIPKFKAGMHIGTAVTAWVGKVKKEIVYHGDLLNTASRIQNKCNEFNHDFIISEDLKEFLPINACLIYSFKGEIYLRGKLNALKLYTVDFCL